jgi:hypothetical protein
VPAWEALHSLITLLKALPPALLAQDHIGLRRPSALADLPRVVVSAGEVQGFPAGIGGVVGSHKVSNTSWSSDTSSFTSGTFTIELWAEDETTLVNLATAVFGALEDPVAAGGAGFAKLATQSVGPINLTGLDGLQPGGATGLRLPLAWTFSFEAVTPTQTGPDGIIKQVHVDVHESDTTDVNEAMDLP